MFAEVRTDESARMVAEWAQDKTHFEKVRVLMTFLAHAEITAAAFGLKTGTCFVKGPNDWDLDALYKAAVAVHPATARRFPARS
jgi:hypothetical protein